jgi:phosphoglycolate phosphatase-like HAD superfamily hydrolase
MHATRTPANETVLVGDSIIDWKTAAAAGTAMCLARYGFGSEGIPDDALTHATRVMDRAAELAGL